MKKYIEVPTVRHELDSVTCDRCKRVDTDIMEIEEYLHYENDAGYGSIMGDGNRLRADICQHCVKEMFSPFLRIEGNYISGGYDGHRRAVYAWELPPNLRSTCPDCNGVGVFGPPEDEEGCRTCLSTGTLFHD